MLYYAAENISEAEGVEGYKRNGENPVLLYSSSCFSSLSCLNGSVHWTQSCHLRYSTVDVFKQNVCTSADLRAARSAEV
jgi:hypothetical protein